MTERVLGPTGGRRRKRLAIFVPLLAIAALVLAIGASAGPVSDAAGFEGDDGDLANANCAVSPIDWNCFAPVSWPGTAPLRTGSATNSGWDFTGLEDWQASTSDSAFGGGVKQDQDCPDLTTQKAANKTDLKRAYFASARVGGDVYLALAWIRIEQNTTSPSSHVGFEFNQGETSCSGTSLVHRTAGDLLFVYDFGGGTTDAPKITLRQWVLTGSCEVSNQSAPCWGPAVDLTDAGYAEGKVNTSGSVIDMVGPAASETLGTNEFGEAIVNLSDAITAVGGDPCRAFGNAYAVSRSSGNSGTAQMKDLVGPANVDINLCGGIVIKKETTAPDEDTDFTFQQDIDDSGSFMLKDGGQEPFTDVPEGTYIVSEDDPGPEYALTDITCETDDGSTWGLVDENDLLAGVEIDLEANDTVTCTFTNTLQSGALMIEKNSTKSGEAVLNDGAVFSYNGSSVTDNGTGDEDDTVGVVCVSGLTPGEYTVNETDPPDGYGGASESDVKVDVEAGTDCDENLPGEGATATFSNDPLADIQVRFRDGGSGETALDEDLSCDNTTGDSSTADTTGWDDTLTVTDIPVDGSGVITITCTIKIDP